MAKIKVKNMSFVPLYVFLTVTFLFGALFLAELEKSYIRGIQREVLQTYTKEIEVPDDHIVRDKIENEYGLSKKDSIRITRLEWYYHLFPHLTYVLAALISGIIFIQWKFKKPIQILTEAVTKITEEEMNFNVNYNYEDELGELCKKTEKMRSVLEERTKEMWKQMDERKRLNAIFSHDLRTPLTVLEGHIDMLQKYSANGVLSETDINEIYSVMNIQIKRMNHYVSSMSVLQRLEDIQIFPQMISVDELVKALKNTADIICAAKKMKFTNRISREWVSVDLEIVLQVCENLLSNAMHYAKTMVNITCENNDHQLMIMVSDDGKGFDSKTIGVATDPFYTTEKKSGGEHFGLGLNICKILCQKHGGNIVLHNQETGGACITATFEMKKELELYEA